MRKELTLESLYGAIHRCRRCPNVVPGLVPRWVIPGAINSLIALMAQSPSKGGVRISGRHWVGADGNLRRSGVFLDKYLRSFGYSLDPTCTEYQRPYTTNVLHCWTGNNGKRDRKPSPKELLNCKPWWLKELASVRPRVIVLLGQPAAESFASVCNDVGSFKQLLSCQGESVSVSSISMKRYTVPHPTAPYCNKSEIYKEVFGPVTKEILKD